MNPPNTSPLAIAEGVIFCACATHGITVKDLRAKSRKHQLVLIRQAVAYAIRTRVGTGISYPKIGALLGLSDHTTIIHAMKVAAGRMDASEHYRAFVESLLAAPAMVPSEAPVALEALRHKKTEKRDNAAGKALAQLSRSMRRAKPLQPTIPAMTNHSDELGNAMLLTEDGRCKPQVLDDWNMIAGSRGLALSILTARAQA